MKVIAYLVIITVSVTVGVLVANIKDVPTRVGLTTMFVSLAVNLIAQIAGII